MLTENQIKKLNELILTIETPRYKTLVTDAVENWKSSENKPAFGVYGVNPKVDVETNDIRYVETGEGCCLLGAYSLNKKVRRTSIDSYGTEKLLNEREINIILTFFDGDLDYEIDKKNVEYKELASLVSKIRSILILNNE
jgi:hypothetical protein